MGAWNTGNSQRLIPVVVGLYFHLLANGTLPQNPRDSSRMAEWRERFGPMMRVLAPLVMIHGFLQLAGVY